MDYLKPYIYKFIQNWLNYCSLIQNCYAEMAIYHLEGFELYNVILFIHFFNEKANVMESNYNHCELIAISIGNLDKCLIELNYVVSQNIQWDEFLDLITVSTHQQSTRPNHPAYPVSSTL